MVVQNSDKKAKKSGVMQNLDGWATAAAVGAFAMIEAFGASYQNGKNDARNEAFLAIEQEESKITEARLRENLFGTTELNAQSEEKFKFLNEHKYEVSDILKEIPNDQRREAAVGKRHLEGHLNPKL